MTETYNSAPMKIQDSAIEKSTGESREKQQQKGVTFGDFSLQDYGTYFYHNGIQSVGVEFLCETYNTTKCWVEEGSKNTFSYLNNIPPPLITNSYTEEEFVTEIKESNETTSMLNESSAEQENGGASIVKPSSWASLFKGGTNTTQANINGIPIISVQVENDSETKEDKVISLIDMDSDKRALAMAEKIHQLTPNCNRHHLQLRGLINRGNWCYINTTLQALLGISVISHFYKSLKEFSNANLKVTSTPLTDCMILFFDRFDQINPKHSTKKQDDITTGNAFEPRWIYDVLPVMKTTLSEKGRQEDAEEFLSFLLNGMHDELVALDELVKKTEVKETKEQLNQSDNDQDVVSGHGDEEEWEHVGKKNKATILRKASIEESLIKHLFGGVMRSSVYQMGKKESTTLQPFFTLQLDIQSEKIWTLKEALESYFMKESLHGYTCTQTHTEVEASRRISIEKLPMILIFHLKYFVFDRKGGCQKIHKALEIPVNLEIPKDVMSPNTRIQTTTNARNYKLCAVVYHHGKNAAGGHYTAAVHHGSNFGWVMFDDNNIQRVNVSTVLKHQQGCVPYLLFYEQAR